MRAIFRAAAIALGMAETLVVVSVAAMFASQSGDPLAKVVGPDLLMIIALPIPCSQCRAGDGVVDYHRLIAFTLTVLTVTVAGVVRYFG
jgi:hypothetical protein